MSDRIADLRTLRKLERAAHDGGEPLPWANAADILRGALYDDCDALLDCAEALKPFAAIPLEHIDTPETFGMDVLRARTALARLNGERNVG